MARPSYKAAGSFAAWVAIIAVVLNALWPLIAQLRAELAAMQMEDCSEPGMRQSAAEEQDSAAAEPSPLMPHCAFCSLVAGGFAVLVADRFDPAPLMIDATEFRPTLPEVRPLVSSSYSPAHSGAPPFLA